MKSQSGNNWQKGLELFFQLSGWLVGPLIAALFLGRWLDEKYGTDPWLFLAATGFAFIITIFGIYKQAIKFIKNIEQEVKNKTNNFKSEDASIKQNDREKT